MILSVAVDPGAHPAGTVKVMRHGPETVKSSSDVPGMKLPSVTILTVPSSPRGTGGDCGSPPPIRVAVAKLRLTEGEVVVAIELPAAPGRIDVISSLGEVTVASSAVTEG